MLKSYISGIFSGRGILASVGFGLFVFVAPIAMSIVCYYFGWEMGAQLPTLLISAFSIFSAMLFSSQVAAFGVFNHMMIEVSPKPSDDEIVAQVGVESFKDRSQDLRRAFRSINAGISILTVSAVLITALTILLVAPISLGNCRVLIVSFICFLVSHFLASLLVTCSHVYNFFDAAYAGEAS